MDRRQQLEYMVKELKELIDSGKARDRIDSIKSKFTKAIHETLYELKHNYKADELYETIDQVAKEFGINPDIPVGVKNLETVRENIAKHRKIKLNKKVAIASGTLVASGILLSQVTGIVNEQSKNVNMNNVTADNNEDEKQTLAEFQKELEKIYGEDIKKNANMRTSLLKAGVNLTSDNVIDIFDIANIKNLTEEQQKEFASAGHEITIHEWLDFSTQLMDDMLDVNKDTIPFNAHDLFINDSDMADMINEVMNYYVEWNATHSNETKQKFVSFYDNFKDNYKSYIEKNAAAAELIANLSAAAMQPGYGLYSVENAPELVEQNNSIVAEARKNLGADLEVDYSLIDLSDPAIEQKVTDTVALNDYIFFNNTFSKEEIENSKLLVKFISNLNTLSVQQNHSLSEKLDLSNTKNTWMTFSNAFADSLVNNKLDASLFDASDIFVNDENAVNNVNELVRIVSAYNNAKEEDKSKFVAEFSDFYWNYSMNLQEGLVKNNASTELILNVLAHCAANPNIGLKIDETATVNNIEGKYKNLTKVLVGDAEEIKKAVECNNIDEYTIDETGQIEAERSYYAQSLQTLNEQITSTYLISEDSKYSKDSSSYAETYLKKYSLETRKEEINRHEYKKNRVDALTKDVELVPNKDREELMSQMNLSNGGFVASVASGYSSTSVNKTIHEKADEYTVKSGDGEYANSSMEKWTQEQVEEAEKKAEESLKEEPKEEFIDIEDVVVEEEVKTEDKPLTEEEKQENQEAVDKGDITEDERDDMNNNNEVIVDEKEDGNEIDHVNENDEFTPLTVYQMLQNNDIDLDTYNSIIEQFKNDQYITEEQYNIMMSRNEEAIKEMDKEFHMGNNSVDNSNIESEKEEENKNESTNSSTDNKTEEEINKNESTNSSTENTTEETDNKEEITNNDNNSNQTPPEETIIDENDILYDSNGNMIGFIEDGIKYVLNPESGMFEAEKQEGNTFEDATDKEKEEGSYIESEVPVVENKETKEETAKAVETNNAQEAREETAKAVEANNAQEAKEETTKAIEINNAQEAREETTKAIETNNAQEAREETTKAIETNNAQETKEETVKAVETNNAQETKEETVKAVETNNAQEVKEETAKAVETNNAQETKEETAKAVETNNAQEAKEETSKVVETNNVQEVKEETTKEVENVRQAQIEALKAEQAQLEAIKAEQQALNQNVNIK